MQWLFLLVSSTAVHCDSVKVGIPWYIDGRPKISASYNRESAAMWTKQTTFHTMSRHFEEI